jgi:hypothetical protein
MALGAEPRRTEKKTPLVGKIPGSGILVIATGNSDNANSRAANRFACWLMNDDKARKPGAATWVDFVVQKTLNAQ